MSPISEARRKANDKYIKSQDEIKIRVDKGRKQFIQGVASAQGESLNGFVTTAIDEHIERLGGLQDEQSGSPEQLISSANRGLKTAERSLNAIFDLAHDEKFRTQLKALLPEKLSGLDPQVLYDRIVAINVERDKSADK